MDSSVEDPKKNKNKNKYNLKIELPFDPAVLVVGIHPKNKKH